MVTNNYNPIIFNVGQGGVGIGNVNIGGPGVGGFGGGGGRGGGGGGGLGGGGSGGLIGPGGQGGGLIGPGGGGGGGLIGPGGGGGGGLIGPSGGGGGGLIGAGAGGATGNNDPKEIIRIMAKTPILRQVYFSAAPYQPIGSAVMPGTLIPIRDQIPNPDDFVVHYISYDPNTDIRNYNFSWDDDKNSWRYIGVNHVGGQMDGKCGLCYYVGGRSSVDLGGNIGRVSLPFTPTDKFNPDRRQGIYHLLGRSYVWGWLYNTN